MEPLTFYFDRCFGCRFPEALRRARPPFTVEFQHDRRNKFNFREDMPDDEWLTIAGQKQWIVFSHDRKFHKIDMESLAITQHQVGCFYLWGSNAGTWEKLQCFMRAYDRMREAILTTPRPFIFDVAQNGRLRRVPISQPEPV